jgi:hypothetical protein
MKRLIGLNLAAAVLTAVFAGSARADEAENRCTLKTLRGTYLLTARGYNIVAGVPQPKSIIEVVEFNGDGTAFVPAGTRSVNGSVFRGLTGPGVYTLEPDCSGTLMFDGPTGPAFDIFVAPHGKELWAIQTNPNTVFLGSAVRTSHLEGR